MFLPHCSIGKPKFTVLMMTSSGAAALQCAKHKTQRRQVTLFPNSLGRKKQSSSGSPLTYITKENSLALSQLPLSVLFPFRRLLDSCCKMPMNRCCCYLTLPSTCFQLGNIFRTIWQNLFSFCGTAQLIRFIHMLCLHSVRLLDL